ncbi:MAG: hypothetical protein R3Y47_03020 [Lachnospiraceae bacterium]
MNKWMKSCVIVAIISCLLGLGCIIVGALAGGVSAFKNAVAAGEFSYSFGDFTMNSSIMSSDTYRVESGSETYTYSVDEVGEICMDIVGAEVYMHDTSEEEIRVEVYSSQYASVVLEGDCLCIETDYEDNIARNSVFSFWQDTSPVEIYIYIPFDSGFVLEELDAEVTGALFYIEEIQTKDLDIELVGGTVEIDGDFTGTAEISVVAGDFEMKTARGVESYNYVLDGIAVSNIVIGDNSDVVLADQENIRYHNEEGSIFYIECSAGNVEIY